MAVYSAADPGFPSATVGCAKPKGGVTNLLHGNFFCQKTAWKLKKLDREGGGGRTSLAGMI